MFGSMNASLPSEMVEETRRRLSILAGLTLAIFVVYLLLYLTVWREQISDALYLNVVIMAVTGYLVFHLRRCRTASSIVLAGAIFECMLCLALEVMQFIAIKVAALPSTVAMPMISWSAATILIFPLFTPATPRVILVTSLCAAMMGPLGYFLALYVGGQRFDDPGVLSSYFVPTFMCAFVAYVPARVLHNLGRTIKKARQLGSYELVETLGKGGMGEVWRARHKMLVRPAAIKLIRPDAGDIDRLRERFELEAQATANLESPHTVELYDFGVAEDGAFYYVMELLRGIDLDTMVQRFGQQPASRVVFLLIQVCDSLDDAHRASLVHRDIKPANIYIANKGRRYDFVKVLDFGLVKLKGGGGEIEDIGKTAENKVIGTPAYLPPEISIGDGEIDGRADIYALGCVAYYLLTGKMVFEAETAMKTVVAHATEEPVPPSQRTDNPIPARLEKIIMQCLAKKPEQRPATALELAGLLQQCVFHEPWNDERARKWWSDNLSEALEKRPLRDDAAPTAMLRPA